MANNNAETTTNVLVPYNFYKEQGFDDATIQDYMRPKLTNMGYSQDQINQYFYNKGPEAATSVQIATSAVDKVEEFGRYIDGLANATGKNLGFTDAIKLGWQESVTGMVLRGGLPDPLTEEEFASLNIFERAAVGISSLVSDLPIYAIGGFVGAKAFAPIGGAIGARVAGPKGAAAGTALATTVGSAVGAFSFHAGMRQALVDSYTRGEVASWDEFFVRMGNIGTESAKGAALGLVMSGAGMVGRALQKTAFIAKAPSYVSKVTPLGMEVMGLTGGAAALEGKVPTADDFIVNTLMVVGIKGVGQSPAAIKGMNEKIGRYVKEKFVLEGKSPKETAEAILNDPVEYQMAMADREVTTPRKEQIDIYDSGAPIKYARGKKPTDIKRATKRKGVPVLDKEGFDPTKAISEADIVTEISNLFNETVDTLALNVAKTPRQMGIFAFINNNTGELRIQNARDLRFFSHELGHALDKASRGRLTKKLMRNDTVMSELAEMASGNNGTAKAIAEEGLAEFTARFILNNESARREAPWTYQLFSDLLTEGPVELKNVLDTMRTRLQEYNDQAGIYKVSSQISLTPKEIKEHPELSIKDKVIYNLIKELDDKAPLRLLENQIFGKDPNAEIKPSARSPYILARNYAGIAGTIEAYINGIPVEFKNKKEINGAKNLVSILNEVGEKNYDEFSTYLVARRAIELNKRGIKTGIPIFEANNVVKSLNKKYSKAASEFTEWHSSLMRYLRDAGVISEKGYNDITKLNKDFVSFRRDLSNRVGKAFGKSKTTKVKYIKGSNEAIINPIESALYLAYSLIPLAERNRIALTIGDLASKKGSAEFITRQSISGDMFNLKNKVINEAVVKSKTTSAKVKEQAQKELDMFEQIEQYNESLAKKLGPNEFVAYRNGKAEVYRVKDQDIANLIKEGMSANIRLESLLKPLQQGIRVLRAGATTLNVAFPFPNFVRDTTFAVFNSTKGVSILKKYPEALKSIFNNDPTFREFKANGGAMGTFFSADRFAINLQLKELTQTGYMKRVWNSLKEGHLLDFLDEAVNPLRRFNEIIELTPRMAEFLIQSEGKPRTFENLTGASFNARNITVDFAKGGARLKFMNNFYLFLKANILGVEQAVKIMKDPKKAPKAIVALGILGIYEALANYDYKKGKEDDATREQPDYVRDANYVMKFQGYVLKIPKPRTIGWISTLFSKSTTNLLNTLKGTEREEIVMDLAKSAVSELAGGFTPLQLMSPTALTPLVETWANKHLYFNTPLVPFYLENTLPEYQYKSSTLEASKLISRTLGRVIGRENTLSPIKIENLVRGYAGNLGTMLLSGFDIALRKTGAVPDYNKATEASVLNNSFVRAFIIRYPANAGTKSIGKFYEEFTSISKQYASPVAAEKYAVKAIYGQLQNIQKNMSDINKTIYAINENTRMSKDEKRQNIEKLYLTLNAFAQRGLTIKKKYDNRINFSQKN